MRWIWRVTTDAPHLVVADLSLVSSRETVTVDGTVVSDQNSMKFRNEHPLDLGKGHTASVLVSTAWYGLPRCRLRVDGKEIPALKGAEADVPVPPAEKVPWWAWIFAAACAAIPIVTLGGAFPAGIGFGGAAGCVAASKLRNLPVAARIGACAGIAVGCWAGLFLLLAAIGPRRR